MKAIDFGSDELFIENYKKLKSSRKMGELYGCSKNVITAHAQKIGYDYSGNKEIKITAIPVETVYSLYLELKSCQKVAELYDCSATAVRKYLNSNGYNLTNQNNKLDTITDEEFINKYNELKNARKVGEYFNCSSTAILKHAEKIGYNPNSNKDYKLSELQKQEIINQYSEKTSTKLAKEYGVSRGMITKVWHDNHLFGKEITQETTEIDLTGQQFGKWTVQYKTDKRTNSGGIYWHCKCQCGVERDVSSLSLRQGVSQSCGLHPEVSRGNEKIAKILSDNKIPFVREKTFETCKDKKLLPFDFYVNDTYLIEYDGIQHYNENTLYYSESTIQHDKYKTQWCKENNIPLIRIPYTQFNNLNLSDLKIETTKFLDE